MHQRRRAISLHAFHGKEETHLNQESETSTVIESLAMISISLPVLTSSQNSEKFL